MKKVTRTMMNLKKMSYNELEDIMVELRDQIEDLCSWGCGMDDVDPRFKNNVEEARDLSLDQQYLETEHDLIQYIREADKVLMRKQTIEAMYNFTF